MERAIEWQGQSAAGRPTNEVFVRNGLLLQQLLLLLRVKRATIPFNEHHIPENDYYG